MIQLTPQMRLLVAVAPVDFRRGIDGLCRLCREMLSADPFSGTVFVFRNQRGTAIKLLAYTTNVYLRAVELHDHRGRFRLARPRAHDPSYPDLVRVGTSLR